MASSASCRCGSYGTEIEIIHSQLFAKVRLKKFCFLWGYCYSNCKYGSTYAFKGRFYVRNFSLKNLCMQLSYFFFNSRAFKMFSVKHFGYNLLAVILWEKKMLNCGVLRLLVILNLHYARCSFFKAAQPFWWWPIILPIFQLGWFSSIKSHFEYSIYCILVTIYISYTFSPEQHDHQDEHSMEILDFTTSCFFLIK